MKRKLLLLIIGISSLSFAQVGINTTNPNLNSDLELGSTNKSLLLNRVPNPAAIANAVNGMLIYDVSEQCVKAFQGGAWSQCFWKESSSFVLSCTSATFTPSTATQGQSYSGTLTIPYTGGDGSAYPGQTIPSNGLVATLVGGTLAVGNGSLQFSVSGFPITAGAATFSTTVNGSTCSSISIPVNNGTPILPPNISIEGRYFIASVYDQDYSPFTAPTGPATTNRPVAADGSNETLVDLQGVIPSSGLTVYIPATVTGSGTGTIGAWSSTINVPASLTEDGISRNITLSWSSQSYNASTKSIVATLTAQGGALNARKLDINAGIGNDYLGVLLGRFQLPVAGSKNYDVRIIAAIPDRKFNEPDILGAFNHYFLYLPIQAEDGNVWLNNNLGADYTNINSPSFNIGQQATAATDFKAYGSLFQWGRSPDGHDLIQWVSGNTGTAVNPTVTNTANDNPTDTRFIATGSDWRVTGSTTLWESSSSANSPCPTGFKVPSQGQLQAYLNASNITDGITGAAASKLALSAAGTRDAGLGNISTVTTGFSALYWSSTAGSQSSPAASTLQIGQFGVPSATFSASKAQGISVRCIKE